MVYVLYGVEWCMVNGEWYGLVLPGMVLRGMVWYSMALDGILQYDTTRSLLDR